jgi:hypothetical protein
LWKFKRKKICVIEEINISRKNKRDKLINFLIETTDLYDFSMLKNVEVFNKKIHKILRHSCSIWDLVKEFEWILTTW